MTSALATLWRMVWRSAPTAPDGKTDEHAAGGASDDKNSLTGLFSALETLLSNPLWVPRRTIIVALGFDEECSGRRGAGHIGPFLEKRYGPNSLALILDEGGMGLR